MDQALSPDDFLDRVFRMTRGDGSLVSPAVLLQPDGRVIGTRHENESYWAIREGCLEFQNRERVPTTRFINTRTDDKGWHLDGPFLPAAWVKHVLTAAPRDTQPQEAADGDPIKSGLYQKHNGGGFLAPSDLVVNEIKPRRIALIGSCMLDVLGFHRNNPAGCPADLLVMNNADSLPDRLSDEVDASAYDFAVIQIPFRAIYSDTLVSLLDYNSLAAYENAFEEACRRLGFHLERRMEWNTRHGMLTFVSNFFVPQHNIMGSLFPRFDLRNPEYFVARLNEELERLVRSHRNAYVVDVDRISASFGRRYFQDDMTAHTAHGSFRGVTDWDTSRIEPLAPMASHYDGLPTHAFALAVWAELMSMWRVVRQADSVKLVVMDLDDTLWNGISGDLSEVGPWMLEGWPMGIVEALQYLKKRGILLAIISKNEDQRIRAIWPRIFGDRLSLDDFAAVYVNWQPKAQNMRALLDVVNLLPRNVLFVDDNPAERAAMASAFPDMRILGRHPYYLRRILLWSSETQVPSLTAESGRRTEMVQAQVVRETERKQLTREDFLMEAAPVVTMMPIDGIDHPRFARAFELLNKTNQFNTTGQRRTSEEMQRLFAAGAQIHSFEVVDKYTDYGLVGVIVALGANIEQWAMSCRVLGYQIEEAVMATIVHAMRASGQAVITGKLVETDVNFPCRGLFSKCGFKRNGDIWWLDADTSLTVPGHVRIVAAADGNRVPSASPAAA
jgi:FkbH-like protein